MITLNGALVRTPETPSLSDVRDLLADVLRRLPPESGDDSDLASAYRTWGTPDPFGTFVTGDSLVESGRAGSAEPQVFFLVWDSKDRSMPYLASLVMQVSGWTLEWLASQCASCFGSGIADRAPCETCGGSGWGTLDSTPCRYQLAIPDSLPARLAV